MKLISKTKNSNRKVFIGALCKIFDVVIGIFTLGYYRGNLEYEYLLGGMR